jgi:hypothetical protein
VQAQSRRSGQPTSNSSLTERDKVVFAVGGFGAGPTLLVIDVNWMFCGDWPCRSSNASSAAQFLVRTAQVPDFLDRLLSARSSCDLAAFRSGNPH